MVSYGRPFTGDYPVTQKYGEKITSAFHTGIDYACPAGTRILAAAKGIVMFEGWDNTGFGNCVILQHEDGNATLYAHLSYIAFGLVAGQHVAQGKIIGMSGSSGNSTGPHLHFEARKVWSDYKSHFDPASLIGAAFAQHKEEKCCLKAADQLGGDVKIVAPAGAWAWSPNFDKRQTVYINGQKLHFTGNTAERNGYTYCEVYPDPPKYWVAVHDGTTQILDNA